MNTSLLNPSHPADLTEREMLDLIAEVCGIEILHSSIPDLSPRRADTMEIWNPMRDDGDSQRVAVHLFLSVIQTKSKNPEVEDHKVHIEGTNIVEFHGKDPNAATRLAIGRAAVEKALSRRRAQEA